MKNLAEGVTYMSFEDEDLGKKIGPLDVESAKWLLANFRNPLVKVEARARGGHCTWGRARLISVNEKKETAIIQPFGHKKTEEMELRYLRKWKNSMTEDNRRDEPIVFIDEPAARNKPLTATLGEHAFKGLTLAKEQLPTPPPPPAEKTEKIEEKQGRAKYGKGIKRNGQEDADLIRKLRASKKTGDDILAITGIPKSTQSFLVRKYPEVTAAPGIFEDEIRFQKAQAEAPKVEVLAEQPIEVTPVKLPDPVPVQAPTQYAITLTNDAESELVTAIRGILRLRISDTAKLLAIEGLLS